MQEEGSQATVAPQKTVTQIPRPATEYYLQRGHKGELPPVWRPRCIWFQMDEDHHSTMDEWWLPESARGVVFVKGQTYFIQGDFVYYDERTVDGGVTWTAVGTSWNPKSPFYEAYASEIEAQDVGTTEGVLGAYMPQVTDGEADAPVSDDPPCGPLGMPSSYATASPMDLGNAWPDSDDEECVLHFDDAATLAKCYNIAVGANPSNTVTEPTRALEVLVEGCGAIEQGVAEDAGEGRKLASHPIGCEAPSLRGRNPFRFAVRLLKRLLKLGNNIFKRG
jgi:hypothetical protein